MTYYASKHGAGRRNTEGAIVTRQSFQSGGALRASSRETFGQLPYELQDRFVADNPTYVVYSYSTPIAWFGEKGWTVPKQKYSSTTSSHQSLVRMALYDIESTEV